MFIKSAMKRGNPLLMAPLALAAAVGSVAQAAEVKIPDMTLTASLRTGYVYSDNDKSPSTSDFALNSFNIYLNTKITDNIKFSFSSEFNGSPGSTTYNTVQVQDAIAQFEFDPKCNFWAGRFLPPSDRANSYGAYFSDNWNFATDGTQDGYPFIAYGRDDGVAYWGDFGKMLKVSAGLFDIPSTTNTNDTLAAARVQLDFWDPEPGYYLNGTYYGEKDILALGAAVNSVNSKNTANVDFLMEKKVSGGGAVTVEGEYINYDKLGGYSADFTSGNSWYGLVAYLFPHAVGPGKVQLLGKTGNTRYTKGPTADYDQTTSEFNVNYIIKSFNARVSLFVKDVSYSNTAPAAAEDNTQYGLGVQLMTL